MPNGPHARRAVGGLALCFAVAAAGLAGCVAPEEPDDPLIGVCPHWTPRADPIQQTVDLEPGGNRSHEWVPRDEATGAPRPVDGDRRFERILVELRSLSLDEEGDRPAVLLSATSQGADLLLYEHGVQERPRSYPVAVLADAEADRVFDVYLSSVSQDAEWTPAPITLHWEARDAAAQVTFQVTLLDRVCGVP